MNGGQFQWGRPLTREHIFRSAWKKQLDVRENKREFYQVQSGGTERIRGPLFALTTKVVSGDCNNGWMNDAGRSRTWTLLSCRSESHPGAARLPLNSRRWRTRFSIAN